jgi:hypothetical protein
MICRWILPTMRNVSGKRCRENENTIYVQRIFFRKSYGMCDNVEEYGRARHARGDKVIRRMCFACWVTKATDTHSGHEICIAFPRQQRLRERASLLPLYIYWLTVIAFHFEQLQ